MYLQCVYIYMKYILFATYGSEQKHPTSSSEANRTKAEEPEDPSLAIPLRAWLRRLIGPLELLMAFFLEYKETN